ncbi:MFS transporter [Nocardia sp. NPDC049190]|uniref:MFS transporter n=1 Tax=Nocardia sp. NPDC049190 TaxID=3155650 RepID=UPI0033CC6157
MSGSRTVYVDRNFALLWSGNAASLVGFFGVRIAYPLLTLAATDNPALAGWVTFAVTVPSLIFQIPAGIAADYGNQRRILLICQSAGLSAACLAITVVILQIPYFAPVLMLTAFVEGTANVFFEVSELAAVRNIVDAEDRGVALSFLSAEKPVAIVIGRATGAAAYGAAAWLPFAVNTMSYIFCRKTLQAIRWNTPARAAGPALRERLTDGMGSVVRDGARSAWAEPFLRTTTAISGLTNMIIQVAILLIMVKLDDSDSPAWTIGIVLGAAGVGGIVGSAAATKLITWFGRARVYHGALWAYTALMLPVSLSSNPVVLAIAWFAVGCSGLIITVLMSIFRVEVIPEETLGRTVGILTMVTDGSVAFGALLGGYLVSGLGTTGVGILLTGAMFVVAVSTRRMTIPA